MVRCKIRSALVTALAFTLLGVGQASALDAYMRLTGESQGEIRGCVTDLGRENSIQLTAFGHSVISPRDAASGLPTGKRQHKPITVRMDVGCRSTPGLYNAFANNENITSLEIRFWRPNRLGKLLQIYTIQLTNASISGISSSAAGAEGLTELVVSFTYQSIVWTIEAGGISASDDWETPVF